MVSHLPHSPPEGLPFQQGTEDDGFLKHLDRTLTRANGRARQKLQTWGKMLDAAGWCVALPDPGRETWFSPNARVDLEKRGWVPGEGREISGLLPAGSQLPGGACVWAACGVEEVRISPPVRLTGREREVLHWLRAGKSDSETAVILGCAVRTVEKHVANLYRKLRISNRADAILHSIGIPD